MGNTQILETLDDEPDTDATDDVVDDDTSTDPPADDVDADEQDDDDDDETFMASLTEPQRARFTALQESNAKANGNAKKWRLKATGKTGPQPPKPGPPKPKAPATGDAVDRESLLAELREEFKTEQRVERITGIARTALADSGLVLPEDTAARRKALAKATRLLDLEGAEDEDDVDVAIAELKREMPAMFKRVRRKPGGAATAGPRSQAPAKAKTKVGKIADLFD